MIRGYHCHTQSDWIFNSIMTAYYTLQMYDFTLKKKKTYKVVVLKPKTSSLTDLNAQTSTSNHYNVFSPFLVQSSRNLGIQPEISWILIQVIFFCYKPLSRTPQKTCDTCQTVNSLVHYQHWVWCWWHSKYSLIYCCVI
jgi:hypothetical protein